MAKEPTKQISARISESKFEALENFRWDPTRRLEMSGILSAAVDLFIEANGIEVAAPDRDSQ